MSGAVFREVIEHTPSCVQFSMYTKEEIEKLSACKITNPILFDSLNNPCQNGLYDPRLGPIGRFDTCPTCKLSPLLCPGHLGHIELPFPVFNVFFFPVIYTLIRGKCFQCHKMRWSRTKMDEFFVHLNSLPKDPRRYLEISKFMQNLRPNASIVEGFTKLFVTPIGQVGRRVNAGLGVDLNNIASFYTPRDVYNQLKLTWEVDHDIMSCMYPITQPAGIHGYKILFLDSLPVPPNRFRPPSVNNGQTFEHPASAYLGQILTTRRELLRAARPVSIENTADDEEIDDSVIDEAQAANESKQAHTTRIQRIINLYFKLQNEVNTYLDCDKNAHPVYGVLPNPGIRQILERKEGLFRQNMMGKRVNFSARSVISPDPYIATSEVGVPEVFAKTLTFAEPVTPFNAERLRAAVLNGTHNYPGANFVEDEYGNVKNLNKMDPEQREGLAKLLLTPSEDPTALPKRVYRHLINGDVLMVNRQPTLHSASILAHTAKVLKNQRTVRLHYANCSSYNADFDGDEMNLHFPQSQEARAEAYNIASADHMYTTPTAGNPIRGLIQDHVMGGFF
ncbi:hypothetical protein GEMRC1_004147 [Eukaryota sp. GEM-RC1]